MKKDKVQNDKVQPDDEISNEDLDQVAGSGCKVIKAPTGGFKEKLSDTERWQV